MYSTKFQNKNVQVDAGRYVTINTPYVAGAEKLPARWKEKQFAVPQSPTNAGNGYFGYGGKPFSYSPEPFVGPRPYMKEEPLDQRKLGFGTHDASRRDEFSQTIRTEQYRSTLRKEAAMAPRVDQVKIDNDTISALSGPTSRRCVEGKKEIRHLYDIGRGNDTPFNPRNSRDTFYSIKEGYQREKCVGAIRTASQEVGDGAWTCKYTKPEFSAPSGVKKFLDNSHLESPR